MNRQEACIKLMEIMRNEGLSTLTPCYIRLSNEELLKWANKPYWTVQEATLLSLSLNPTKQDADASKDLDLRLQTSDSFEEVWDLIDRSLKRQDLTYTTVPEVDEGDQV